MGLRTANPDELERVRKLLDGGHLRYILVHGVIRWGMLTAVLFSSVKWLWHKEAFLDVLPSALITFGVGGVLFGEMMWHRLRARCDRLERVPPG